MFQYVLSKSENSSTKVFSEKLFSSQRTHYYELLMNPNFSGKRSCVRPYCPVTLSKVSGKILRPDNEKSTETEDIYLEEMLWQEVVCGQIDKVLWRRCRTAELPRFRAK